MASKDFISNTRISTKLRCRVFCKKYFESIDFTETMTDDCKSLGGGLKAYNINLSFEQHIPDVSLLNFYAPQCLHTTNVIYFAEKFIWI